MHPQDERWSGYGRAYDDYVDAPDERIRAELSKRLAMAGLDPSAIEIRVEKGEVALSGAVADAAVRRRIERIVGAVPGVHEVRSALAVG